MRSMYVHAYLRVWQVGGANVNATKLAVVWIGAVLDSKYLLLSSPLSCCFEGARRTLCIL